MVIDLTNNTDLIRGMDSQQPQSFLRNQGLGFADLTQTDIQNAIAVANAEATFLANLWRDIQGKDPLPANLQAPAYTVQLAPETKAMLMWGGIGLLAFFVLSRK